MKKYLFVIVLLALVVFGSGCATTTKTYSASGISFNYPDTWKLGNKTVGNQTLIALASPEVNQTNGTKGATVIIDYLMKNSTVSAQGLRQGLTQSAQQAGLNVTPTTTTIIDNGINVNDTTITGTVNGTQMQIRAIDFEKNNRVYLMIQSIGADLQTQKQNFEVILNSLKIQ